MLTTLGLDARGRSPSWWGMGPGSAFWRMLVNRLGPQVCRDEGRLGDRARRQSGVEPLVQSR